MSGASLTVMKHLAASPEEVFDAWTTPDHMAGWLSPMGPASIPRLELRVGGEFQIDMHGEGKTYVHKGRYVEIDRPRRLAFTWVSDGTGQTESLVTIDLEADGDGTALTLTHERLPGEDARKAHEQGWMAIVAKLAAAFAGSAKTGS